MWFTLRCIGRSVDQNALGRSSVVSRSQWTIQLFLDPVYVKAQIAKAWFELVMPQAFTNFGGFSGENRREISLVRISSKVLEGIILRPLSSTRDKSQNMSIFFCRSIMFVFLDVKAAFALANRATLSHCLPLKLIPDKLIPRIQFQYVNSRSRPSSRSWLSITRVHHENWCFPGLFP